MLARFVTAKGDVGFWCASRATAEIVARMGFFVNEMGPENRIELEGYNFSGRSKRALRLAINRAAKLGHITRECSFRKLEAAQVKALSDAWRQQRTVRTREVSFLNRPMAFEDETDVRKFFTFNADGKLIAFSSYDPVYTGGLIVGYCNHIKRHLPGVDSLVANAMTCHAITTFQQEGLKLLLLGISPFADIKGIDDDAFSAVGGSGAVSGPPTAIHCSIGWCIRFAACTSTSGNIAGPRSRPTTPPTGDRACAVFSRCSGPAALFKLVFPSRDPAR